MFHPKRRQILFGVSLMLLALLLTGCDVNQSGMSKRIDTLLDKANYCQVDSDCTYTYDVTGCYVYVNKEADLRSVRSLIQDYIAKYSSPIAECQPVPSPTCDAGKCKSLPRKLDDMERTWREQEIENYRIDVWDASFHHIQLNRVIVRNGRVAEATALKCDPAPLELGSCRVRPFEAEDYTVSGLFDKARKIAGNSFEIWQSLHATITFDPVYGFPDFIAVSPENVTDSGGSLRVEAFEILPPITVTPSATPTPSTTPTPSATPTPSITPTPAVTSTPPAEDELSQGKTYYEARDYESAVTQFQAVLASDPENVDAYALLGWGYIKLDQIEEALAAFKTAIRLDPEHSRAYAGLCTAQALLGILDEASETCRYAQELNPKDADAYYGAGLVLLAQERLDEAVTVLTKAIELEPKHDDALIALGRAYSGLGAFRDAHSVLSRAMRVNPNNAVAAATLAETYLLRGWFESAISEYQKAIALDPENVSAHFGLAEAYRRKGRIEEAISEYNATLALQPDEALSAKVATLISWLQRLQSGESYSRLRFDVVLEGETEKSLAFYGANGGVVVVEATPDAASDAVVSIKNAVTGETLAVADDFSVGLAEFLIYRIPEESGVEEYEIVVAAADGGGDYEISVVASTQIILTAPTDVDYYRIDGHLSPDGSVKFLVETKEGDSHLSVGAYTDEDADLVLHIGLFAPDDPTTHLAESKVLENGKDAFLFYAHPKAGTYLIQVSVMSGNSGRYRLIIP